MVNLHRRYNFVTLAPTELGGSFENMKVLSILGATEAIKYRDIYTLHKKMARLLSQELSVDDLTYILFEAPNKSTVLLAYEYLEKDSIVQVENLDLLIEVPNANTESIKIILDALTSLGYVGCKITTKK